MREIYIPELFKGCWYEILHRPLTLLHILLVEALMAFVPGYLFKDVCIVNGLGEQRGCLPMEHRTRCLTVQYNKDNISF